MEGFTINLALAAAFFFAALYPSYLSAQRANISVDWNAELRKAQAGIQRQPNSAFWHNQAGVAYEALGDSGHALKELKLASRLDNTNPLEDYALFAFYQRKAMLSREREVLMDALAKDPRNPLGHFELADVLERGGRLPESLMEYKKAKQLLTEVKGPEYTDPRGNPYDVAAVRKQIDEAIHRVATLVNSK